MPMTKTGSSSTRPGSRTTNTRNTRPTPSTPTTTTSTATTSSKEKTPGLAWKWFGFPWAHVAGFFLAASFIGVWLSDLVGSGVSWIINQLPGTTVTTFQAASAAHKAVTVHNGHVTAHDILIPIIVIGYALMIFDMFRRKAGKKGPDGFAYWAALLLPCLSHAVSGKFGRFVLGYGDTVRNHVGAWTAGWLGDMSVFGIGLFFFGLMLMARHFVHESNDHNPVRDRLLNTYHRFR